MATIEEVLEVEQIDKDIFRGQPVETLLQRTFGGQVACQSLIAAVRTVEPKFTVHSMHAYFLRPGKPKIPTVYLVDRIREGRSFCTRRVQAMQNGEAIFVMSASFHVGDPGIEHMDAIPAVPRADELPDPTTIPELKDRWELKEWSNWDLRIVPLEKSQRIPGIAAQQRVWMRYRDSISDDPTSHVCALAYMSDMLLLGSSLLPHPEQRSRVQLASLDHAMWFMRPFRADEWLLYDQTSPSAGHGRALTQGRIYNADGDLVAAVVQEGLTRLPQE
ncbi:acyl-CoA thioesterase II [Hoyosella rhizosphaerae]|uniref:Acyl-CoA thioesterase 2 n=1 Tax=Hoyosella rhizosphaerae TaxID=1755582 RepID=A0A916U5A8_9ACTN|nr:acyl-CoA thioesterase II [Hoyosella rhizosphaerae]MBN4926414.1 acyl-CoA thioesterase II [Hoyosella rhizosphaerae]GGC59550.1 acyl-CoA thioesterase II [Hoyosella rhizosphaerae]